MFRSFVGALCVLALGVSITLAAEFRAVITKVDGTKVTFTEMKGKEKGDSKTMDADGAKVITGKVDKDTKKFVAGDALKDGLKNDMFSKIGDKGVGATIVTDADNKKITEIRVGGGKKKKADK